MQSFYRRSFWLGLALTQAACGSGNGSVLQSLSSHTPALVQTSTLAGAINPEQQLSLRVALPLRDENSLNALLSDLYDPQSASYGQYLTPQEFAGRFLPTEQQVASVRAALQANGFAVDTDAHGAFLAATASAQDAEAFFHTQLSSYTDPNGQTFFAPSADVSVDDGLQIAGVFGLHTAFALRTNFRMNAAPQVTNTKTLNAAALRSTYNVPTGANGAGQIVGIFELDGYLASDIAAYAKTNNITQPPLNNILVDGISGAVQDAGGQSEVTLDIELVNAMVPAAQQIRVYEAANGGQGAIDAWNEIANPTLGDKQLVSLISSSWGLPEDQITSAEVQREATLFKQMAAQGQTVLVASGDAGANADGKTLGVQDPSSQPYTVAVGGTTLTQAAGVYTSETAWTGSGGGISSLWPIPSWQVSAVSGQASSTKRNVPDVALDADPATGYIIILNGATSNGFGGTSCAAPLWTGFFAQVNQARAAVALPPMGFAAPALYLIGGSSAYTTNFHDIVTGSNGTYTGAKGFDDATGWGSFNAANLIQTFASGYARNTFAAPTNFSPINP